MKKNQIITFMLALLMCLSLMPTNYVEAKAKTKLNKTSITLTVGKSKPIKLKNYTKLNKKKIKKVKWSSSNKKVATVKYSGKYRQNAKITAKSTGNATVKVKFNGKKYSCKVVVKNTNSSVTTETPTTKLTTEQPSTSIPTTETLTNTPSTTESNTPSTTIPTTETHIHSYIQTIKNGDCTHKSQIINTCSICGDIKTEEGDYEHIKINGGTKDIHSQCANCGSVIEDSSKHVYTDSDLTATCTKTGTVKHTCNCGYSYTENIDALGHDYNEKGICKRCFKVNSSINNVLRAYDVSENQDKSIVMYIKDEDNNGLYESYIETLVPGSRLHNSVKQSASVDFLNTGIFSSHIEKVIFVNKTLAPTNSSYLFSEIGSGYNNIYAEDKIGIYNLLNLDTTGVTNMSYMFASFYSKAKEKPTTVIVSNFDTSSVTDMCEMFDNCTFLTSLDISNFDTSNVKNMKAMFYNCTQLTTLDVSKFDTRSVTDMRHMFARCDSLTTLNLHNFDTRNVTKMSAMFNGCRKLTTIDLSSFNTTNVTTMESMFACCDSLTSVNLSTFDTSNVETMERMFNGCESLTILNLKSFNTKNVTNMYNMFSVCEKLKKIDVLIDNWIISNDCNTDEMFADCMATNVTYNYH